ncbi:hypothetical protein Glove_84g136 [Diversispora epigaea]|uniref:Uncharacterized protein n=1 Tax=Diversispora epigaea TaxID=1348612 RepID=A0A397JBH2_9GLOM|nr:hypothetical protein Glove_84g136 [Diversispora epigaea]
MSGVTTQSFWIENFPNGGCISHGEHAKTYYGSKTRCYRIDDSLTTIPINKICQTIYLLTEINDDDDELPYWDDAIDKYFNRPDHPDFHLITYPNYFRDYTIRSKQIQTYFTVETAKID